MSDGNADPDPEGRRGEQRGGVGGGPMHKMPMLQPNRHQTETEGRKAKKNERGNSCIKYN